MKKINRDTKILGIVKNLMNPRKKLAEVNQLVFELEQEVLQITPVEKKLQKRSKK